jgi:hypothetical protein
VAGDAEARSFSCLGPYERENVSASEGSRLGSIVQIRFKATARKERRMRSTQQSAASLIQALGSWSGSEFGVLARGPLSRLVVVDEAQPTTRTEHRASRP